MCSQRPISPPHPTPPTTPTALREALVRYNSSSTPGAHTHTHTHTELPLTVCDSTDEPAHTLRLNTACLPYQTLHTATGGFCQTAYNSGGHKLGEGGSGEVFHCLIALVEGQQPQNVAVKVLRRNSEKVSGHLTMSCL